MNTSEAKLHPIIAPTVGPTRVSPLAIFGWDDAVSAGLAALPDGEPARVVAEHRLGYQVITAIGEVAAVLGGALRATSARQDWPVVGDWVVVRPGPDGTSMVVEAVLSRRSAFIRTGVDGEPQVLAANVDTVLVVDALDRPLHLRRLERYLVLAWESGSRPLVALSKADCAENRDAAL